MKESLYAYGYCVYKQIAYSNAFIKCKYQVLQTVA